MGRYRSIGVGIRGRVMGEVKASETSTSNSSTTRVNCSSELRVLTPAQVSSSSLDHGSKLRGTSWPVAAFLLVNAALGAGVLNYPYAYDKAGGVFFAAFLQIVRPFESIQF
ncbi:hypothetical protein TNCV_1507621 [Trichonephila clavipes]|nr:hypothetical protein TNCV_1507621 [Trichonephila clavipes]